LSPERLQHRHDLALVTRIREGSESAWHELIERYSGVVNAVIRHYLFRDDDRRDAWTGVFAHLHEGGLDRYEGRSSLATWLTVVSRGIVCDFVRSRRGRRCEPRAVASLDPAARLAFRWLYLEGRYPVEVRLDLRRSGLLAPGETLAEVLARVDAVLGTAILRRLAYDLNAGNAGGVAGRMLEYCDEWRREMRERADRATPEAHLFEEQTRETMRRVRELLERLPADDREVVVRRFDDGQTARQIAEEMDLDGPRAAYTAIDRSLRMLRRWLSQPALWVVVAYIFSSFWENPRP
jgi:RNA polymerase sigma factor (sigma-70 family)